VPGGVTGGERVSASETASRRAQFAPFPRVVMILEICQPLLER
jgi:hypothetical protein